MLKHCVVVFDLGKVLVDFDYAIAIRQLVQRGSQLPANIQQLLLQGPLLLDYELGRVSTADFFQQVKSLAGFRGDLAVFRNIFGGIFEPIQPMVDLHAALRRLGLRTFIFSNTSEMVVQYLRQKFVFFREFDGYILSYEHGALKPQARLYEVVETTTHHNGSEIVYIDDRPENVEVGLARGWQAILHENPEATRTKVERVLGFSCSR
jgi:FMN phosphatase YigB (HAD superfamily)